MAGVGCSFQFNFFVMQIVINATRNPEMTSRGRDPPQAGNLQRVQLRRHDPRTRCQKRRLLPTPIATIAAAATYVTAGSGCFRRPNQVVRQQLRDPELVRNRRNAVERVLSKLEKRC
uniref:(northern house mosquito) hypothetical protein n=1 Tax=Culex pipiens TaxID=7175 RepID=A0A8D8EYL2_CULPI